MSTTSEKLHTLKVVELKVIAAKHSLVQSGKKEELIKRLLDNGVTLNDDAGEQLTDVPATGTEAVSGEAYSAAPAPPTTADEPSSTDVSDTTTALPTLTPEQQAMKARAERFGVPFNPNPTTTAKPKASSASASTSKPAPTTATPESKTKSVGSIDKAGLGVPDETLAKRAARFGLPEKKADAAPAAKTAAAPTSAGKPKSAAAQITPEQAAKNAEDEEKKRKRAEKFAKPVSSSEEPDAKKAKV